MSGGRPTTGPYGFSQRVGPALAAAPQDHNDDEQALSSWKGDSLHLTPFLFPAHGELQPSVGIHSFAARTADVHRTASFAPKLLPETRAPLRHAAQFLPSI